MHFLDGSVLRLYSNTTATINEATYDETSGKISVKVNLLLGRVWSKVIQLTTPDSAWEVSTSNAIAIVRGTAFGVSTDGNRSRMFGSEHNVAISAIDIRTKKVINKEPIILSEGKILEWTNEDIKQAVENKRILAVRDISDDADKDWIEENESEDRKINEKVEKFQSEGLNTIDAGRKMFIETHDEELEPLAEEDILQKNDDEIEIKKLNKDDVIKEPVAIDERKVVVPTTNVITVQKNQTPISLQIVRTQTLISVIQEGTKTQFKAIIKFKEGGERDVTSEVVWLVTGPIGSITLDGVFIPKLSDTVSELGEASGVISATWRSVRGEEFSANTEILKVELKFEDDGDRRG